MRCHRAVTLLEVVLAMGILTFLTSMTYWFYASSLTTSKRGTADAQKLRLVRVVLNRMAQEIRQAAVMTVDGQVGISGGAEDISLSTIRVPTREQARKRLLREDPAPPEYDFVRVDYKIVRHPDIMTPDNYEMPLGLARIEHLVPRPLPPQEDTGANPDEQNDGSAGAGTGAEDDGSGDNLNLDQLQETVSDALSQEGDGQNAGLGQDIRWDELYSPEIRYLRFCYYDGNTWWDTWDITGENPLPQLVRVTIGFTPMRPFGEGFNEEEPNEKFCSCLNKDPVDCDPLPADEYSITVRTAHADPLFRSRVSREGQSLAEQMAQTGADQQEPKQ